VELHRRAQTPTSRSYFGVSPYAPAPVYNWTGCYLGLQAGGIAYRNSLVNTWTDGALLGGQIGCNYQIDHLVVGVEGEDAWSSADSTLTAAFFPFPGATAPTTVTTFKNEWDAALAVRGGLAYDRFFVYAKIGAIWSDNHFSTTTTAAAPVGVPPGIFTLAGSVTSPGLLWGFGLEYGLMPKWTVKWETDFAQLAATDMNFSCVAVAPSACPGNASVLSTNSFAVLSKIGINYRW
jgi:outer membrane immunogenic protein